MLASAKHFGSAKSSKCQEEGRNTRKTAWSELSKPYVIRTALYCTDSLSIVFVSDDRNSGRACYETLLKVILHCTQCDGDVVSHKRQNHCLSCKNLPTQGESGNFLLVAGDAMETISIFFLSHVSS